VEWCLAAAATAKEPLLTSSPPLASTAWQVRMTLFTLAIMAKMAESVMRVVSIPAWARVRAICCPSYPGADSATMTWNFRFLAAYFRNSETVLEPP